MTAYYRGGRKHSSRLAAVRNENFILAMMSHSPMTRSRSLLRIDDSRSRRRRIALQQRTSISARAGSPSWGFRERQPS